MTNAITIIEQECTAIAPKLTNDEVAAVLDRVNFYAAEMKRVKALTESLVMEWIRENGDLVISPTVRYYIGTDKSTKCLDQPAAVDALLDAAGGDMGAFCECLAANAIKHGAAKKRLSPAVYDSLFRVEIKESLEEGKPKQKLIKADDAFTGARKPFVRKPTTTPAAEQPATTQGAVSAAPPAETHAGDEAAVLPTVTSRTADAALAPAPNKGATCDAAKSTASSSVVSVGTDLHDSQVAPHHSVSTLPSHAGAGGPSTPTAPAGRGRPRSQPQPAAKPICLTCGAVLRGSVCPQGCTQPNAASQPAPWQHWVDMNGLDAMHTYDAMAPSKQAEAFRGIPPEIRTAVVQKIRKARAVASSPVA